MAKVGVGFLKKLGWVFAPPWLLRLYIKLIFFYTDVNLEMDVGPAWLGGGVHPTVHRVYWLCTNAREGVVCVCVFFFFFKSILLALSLL